MIIWPNVTDLFENNVALKVPFPLNSFRTSESAIVQFTNHSASRAINLCHVSHLRLEQKCNKQVAMQKKTTGSENFHTL